MGKSLEMDDYLIAVIIIAIIVVIWLLTRYSRVAGPSGKCYSVISSLPEEEQAAALIDETNTNVMNFLRHMRIKYGYNPYILSLIRGYDPDVLYENDPRGFGTSFVINKGSKFALCLRTKSPPYNLIDSNTLMFVVLHELTHMAAYDQFGHPTKFWELFKFVLTEADECGIYRLQDFASKPVIYCGLKLDYQPLLDDTLSRATLLYYDRDGNTRSADPIVHRRP